MKLFLFSTIGADWDVSIVPFWVKHYLRLGVEPRNFLITLHTRFEDDRNIENVRKILTSFGIVPQRIWRGIFSSQEMWRYRNQSIETIGDADWILIADSDEFHHYPEDIHRFFGKFEKAGYYAIIGFLWDRVATDYRLRKIQPGYSLYEQFPVMTMYLTKRFMGMAHTKIMAHKKSVIGNRGNHKIFRGRGIGVTSDIKDVLDARALGCFGFDFWVDHFKWTGDILTKLEARVKFYRDQDYDWWQSYEKIITHYRKNGILPNPGMVYRIFDRLTLFRTRYPLEGRLDITKRLFTCCWNVTRVDASALQGKAQVKDEFESLKTVGRE